MKSQRIVLVASSIQVRSEIKQVLGALNYQVIGESNNPEEGLRLVRRVQPDLLVLEPTGRSISLLDIIGQEGEIPTIIVLGPQEQHLLDRVVVAGAAGVIFTPVGVMELAPVILVALNNFSQNARLRQKVRQMEDEIEVRKLIDRAKGKVISEGGMSEADAHRWIQKLSMDKQRSLKRIASDIIKGNIEIPDCET